MSLRGDVKEAMAVAEEEAHSPRTARRIRAEDYEVGSLEFGFGLVTREALEVANAALSVCDEYEKLEVQEYGSPHCLRVHGSLWWEPQRPSFTVYRKKQKPEPTLLEAGEAALEEMRPWRGGVRAGCFEDFDTAYDGLAAAIAKEKARQ